MLGLCTVFFLSSSSSSSTLTSSSSSFSPSFYLSVKEVRVFLSGLSSSNCLKFCSKSSWSFSSSSISSRSSTKVCFSSPLSPVLDSSFAYQWSVIRNFTFYRTFWMAFDSGSAESSSAAAAPAAPTVESSFSFEAYVAVVSLWVSTSSISVSDSSAGFTMKRASASLAELERISAQTKGYLYAWSLELTFLGILVE